MATAGVNSTTDSETSIGVVRRGYSRKLAYLRKHARLSIAALHEAFFGDAEDLEPCDSRTINRLEHEPGARNDSDVLTKALPAEKHWACAAALGLMASPVGVGWGGGRAGANAAPARLLQ